MVMILIFKIKKQVLLKNQLIIMILKIPISAHYLDLVSITWKETIQVLFLERETIVVAIIHLSGIINNKDMSN